MGLRTKFFLECDGCGREGPARAMSIEAEAAALLEGWVFMTATRIGQYRQYCPDCQRGARPEKKDAD